jgi:hypothetical protein
MKAILAAVLCSTVIVGQVGTAAAQYYPPPGGYYYGPRGYDPGYYPAPPPPRYAQPMGWGDPYPANAGPDGRLYCNHRNYRPISGWCQRVW